MRKAMLTVLIVVMGLIVVPVACGNTPGRKTVLVTWADTDPAATFNIYRGASTGVCTGTPTPYVSGITTTSWTDVNPPLGTVVYAVSAVDNTKGGESACSPEAQAVVPAVTTPAPTAVTVTVP